MFHRCKKQHVKCELTMLLVYFTCIWVTVSRQDLHNLGIIEMTTCEKKPSKRHHTTQLSGKLEVWQGEPNWQHSIWSTSSWWSISEIPNIELFEHSLVQRTLHFGRCSLNRRICVCIFAVSIILHWYLSTFLGPTVHNHKTRWFNLYSVCSFIKLLSFSHCHD